MFPIHRISRQQTESTEFLGSKDKFWFRHDDNQRWLFKYTRPAPKQGYTGEHWAEKIAAEIAHALGVPHARAELAMEADEDVPGVILKDFTGDHRHSVLVHGNDVLANYIRNYPKRKTYRTSEHTVENIQQAVRLMDLALPSTFVNSAAIQSSIDVFCGYLLLDALIGNTDRHHENWGILKLETTQDRPEQNQLAPSYDHASSLGRELQDAARERRLDARDPQSSVEAYAHKARSAVYEHVSATRPLSPLDAFVTWARECPSAQMYWLSKLRAVSEVALQMIIEQVPPSMMSLSARRFAIQLLVYNRAQLLASQSHAHERQPKQ